MARIGIYDVLNSNASKRNGAVLRVKLDRVILAECRCEHSNPLKWIRTRPLSEERTEFVRQLTLNNVSQDDIAMILKMPPKQA